MSTVVTTQEYLSTIADDALRTKISELVAGVSVEFHESLFGLLQRFPANDLNRFTELWARVDAGMRLAFVAFVVSGDDPDGRFLAYLDKSEDCQEAIDLAFRAHVESLHDLGRSVARAEDTLQRKRKEEQDVAASVICEAVRAKNALESLQQRLENMVSIENTTVITPLIKGVKQAMVAIGNARTGLRTLVSK